MPVQNPSVTPPLFNTTPEVTNDQTQRILQMLSRAMQQKQFSGKPVTLPVPGQKSTTPPAYMTNNANPHSWGTQRFMYGLSQMIRNGVNAHKENQVAKAESDWEYMQSAMNEVYAAQASGNQQAVQAAQKKLDGFMSDPKRLKNMAKALNQDWLNPEKTTPYGEALKRVNAKTQQKANAAQGLKGLIQHILQIKTQPQLNPQEQTQMAHEIEGKAPVTLGAAGAGSIKDFIDLEKASVAAREKYQYVPGQDGRVWAINKSDPKDAHVVRDAETGTDVKEAPKGKNGPAMVNGIPVGVYHGGQLVIPGSAQWSKEDQQVFDSSMSAAKEKQQLRIDPIVAAELGDPPNPADYPKGRSDPKYGEALKKYGLQAEQIKNRMAGSYGAARAIAWNQYRPVQVMDADGNVYYTTAAAAIQQGLSGAAEGTKLLPRQAQIKDIDVAAGHARDAINALDRPFDAEQIAKLHFALTTDDPTLAGTYMASLASQHLTDKQQDFVVWIQQLNERAMSLRQVAGMGQGAGDLRNAIRAMLPGLRSGNKQMMNKQLDAFDNQVRILSKGIGRPGKTQKNDSPATVKMRAPNGQTQDVPASQVSHYEQLGAKVVQ